MRILWLSTTKSLHNPQVQNSSYNGMGWVESLQQEVSNDPNINLAVAFPSSIEDQSVKCDRTTYYPIYRKESNGFQKILNYYGGYKRNDKNAYLLEIEKIIDDFRPDLVHLFGLECPLSSILWNTKIPTIVHLQGLLGPCSNAFLPVEMDREKIIRYGSFKRELVFRNGFYYTKKLLEVKGEYEKELFKQVKYAMGRTCWDQLILSIYSPTSIYYKVNEVLRPVFYNSQKWEYIRREKITIVSTISETMYKGLDLILKTAKILKEELRLSFEWKVVGIKDRSTFINIFEKTYKIYSTDVNVRYEGIKTAEQLAYLLLNAHIYAHPSYIDNSPNGLCEAQILGLPIIATNVGGISSLIEEGVTGDLVPSNAPYELAYKINNLAKNDDYAKTLSTNARNSAFIRHDKGSIIRDLLKAYEEAIKDFNSAQKMIKNKSTTTFKQGLS